MTTTTALAPGVVLGHEFDESLRRSWLQAVHRAARDCGGRVVGEVVEPGPGSNYYAVRVRLERDAPAVLLLNAPARLVAAARAGGDPVEASPFGFRPVPGPGVFVELGLAVAAVEVLDEPWREEYCAALTTVEQRAVAYHRPGTVGEVLFNWFD